MEARVRALVVSDLHANAEALRAVFARVRRKKFDHIICLGDFVGYGAQPNQVLDSMRTFKGAKKVYIRGNHDRVAAGLDDADGFNAAAKHAAIWTREHLSPPNRRFLRDLVHGPVLRDNVQLCHGSPHDEDEYVFNGHHAAAVFSQTEARFILYGHTHMPVIFALDDNGYVEGAAIRGDATLRLSPSYRYLMNPGSVGQPRDRNPEASFAIFDSKALTVQYFRVPYDVKKTQATIVNAGLPRILADRLSIGT
ncbi:MAG TPA: metallophosphoesterase family protein [Thermoanaerobaculia bacterium]|nr:metallophosphoesterase family protein [Thermoanaerobaculia bacterium]